MVRLAVLACLLAPLSLSAADPVKIGTLSAEPPKEWKAEKTANRLRSHQFKIPSGEEGVPDAELIVSPLSKKAEVMFPGWKAQFAPSDGKTLEDVAKESKAEVGGATLHTLDVHGTWTFKERPFDPKSKEEVKPDYRAIWVIVTEKDEATSVRFSGPEKVIEKHKKEFDAFLKALK
ncbi:hypothetical protein [Limnoglobus roseus]|uniref:Uncharacterized protein n=1 Tax=Limnoglobus roseus TaxID=2598579 RepID=A0A5C1A3N7_9BACT|nr:hypothetical protein [Limnoglobus roseus]QEL13701.1 hypothetical protein PX52LOC_00559 [Limnoglobus roseus]